MRAPRLFLPLALLLAAVGPASMLHAAPAAPAELAPGAYRWLIDGPLDGPLYMIISIERQMVHLYSGDRLVGMASVSTGRQGHGTPKGAFPILQKRQWHRSNIYSNAPMPFMQRLTWTGIALHAGHNPGYPASHGCIRLPYAFAQKLFALTQIGTLVEVTQARLNPALMLDSLLLADSGSAVVTFTPASPMEARSRVPLLKVDPKIYGVWALNR